MRAPLDFPEEPFHDIVGADRLPMLLGKGVKGQTRLQVALQAVDRRGKDFLIFLDEGGHGLIGDLTILLIEQGAQLQFDLVVLFVGDVAEHIVHLVHHTALTSRCRKFLRNRIEHGLVAIAHPQANLFDASRFEIVQQVFPGLFIFSIVFDNRKVTGC